MFISITLKLKNLVLGFWLTLAPWALTLVAVGKLGWCGEERIPAPFPPCLPRSSRKAEESTQWVFLQSTHAHTEWEHTLEKARKLACMLLSPPVLETQLFNCPFQFSIKLIVWGRHLPVYARHYGPLSMWLGLKKGWPAIHTGILFSHSFPVLRAFKSSTWEVKPSLESSVSLSTHV